MPPGRCRASRRGYDLVARRAALVVDGDLLQLAAHAQLLDLGQAVLDHRALDRGLAGALPIDLAFSASGVAGACSVTMAGLAETTA